MRLQTSSGSGAVATVTDYAHPLKLISLETLAPSQTPLSYASPPTAIPVPERPLRLPAEQEATPSPSLAVPAAPEAQATSTCTSIVGSSPTATIPAFCNPSLHVNAPNLLPRNLPTANVSIATTPDKIGCCVECAGMFNCVAWRFVPAFSFPPTDALPGGFEPWGRGSCELVYHTGGLDPGAGVSADGAAAVCPNGKVGEVLEGSENVPGPDSETRRWSNVFYNGWNQGSCGAPVGLFESGTNAGRGDPDTLCSS
ncbi:hypothetical protein DL762_004939 [Monosporascus cannonballus]|uniref:Apple domain-containing protein n=1 Tax=Monosporascus cannonballus TaxID=155416 RepID=A0ABY0H6C7_9PEZI|nr:hypothetical protein DL763_009746 [Monosporascus cannonballus]RYO86061.1 hypothetical protein DL762_004939 [Monosporascus cannonballus]